MDFKVGEDKKKKTHGFTHIHENTILLEAILELEHQEIYKQWINNCDSCKACRVPIITFCNLGTFTYVSGKHQVHQR